MKNTRPSQTVSNNSPRPLHGLLAAAALLCLTSTLAAQSVLVGSPKPTLTPRVIQKEAAANPSSGNVIAGPETDSSIALGDIKLRPTLALRYMQTNGLPLGPGTSIDSSVFTVAPGLAVELGSSWAISYNPSWIYYSEETLKDTTSQAVNIAGATKVNDWTFQFSESFQSSQDILAETAVQTKQHSWITTVSAMRKVGQRSQYSGTIDLNERYGDIFPDSKTWSTDHWFRTQFTPKLNAGIGVGLSKTDFTTGNDMRTEEYMGSIRWLATEKIDLSIQGGLENRHFDQAGVASLRSPTFEISLGYRPFEQTRITVASTRAVSNSFFTDQVERSSGWSIVLNQRLLEKLNLSLTYNDQTSDYKSSAATALPTTRSDDFKSFNASLGVNILKKWTLSAIYQTTKNSSNLGGFGFSTNQYGVELTGAF